MISRIGADNIIVLMMRGTYQWIRQSWSHVQGVQTEKYKMRTYVIRVITLGWALSLSGHGKFAVWLAHQTRNKSQLLRP